MKEAKEQELLRKAIKINQDTIAIVDHNNVDRFPQVERFLGKNNGSFKVIYGATVDMLVHEIIIPVTILVRNQTGLKNLYKIISAIKCANLVRYNKQVITKKEMVKFSEGLLYGLNVLNMTDIYEHLSDEDVASDLIWYDFIMISGDIKNNPEFIKRIITLANKKQKLVISEDDTKIWQTLSFLEDSLVQEIVLDSPTKLASLIGQVEIIKNKVYFPQMKKSKEIFMKQIYANAHHLYGNTLPSLVEMRIQEELYGKDKKSSSGIINMQSESIYLIYLALTNKSHELGYPILPRGSLSSSFLAYLIGLTDINPLPSHYHCLTCGYSEFNDQNERPLSKTYPCGIDLPNKKCPHCNTFMKQDGFNLSYEMFLGPKVDKYPLINMNFALTIQNTLEDYLEELFGSQNVLRAGVTTYREKNKLTGQNPGGWFIVPKNFTIYDFTPISYPNDNPNYKHKITLFDYHDMEKHLIKWNILGHQIPDDIKKLEEQTKRKANSIPLNDQETFQFLSQGQTDDIFEFSKTLAKDLLKRKKPSTFSELINILGIVHNEEDNKADNLILFREDMYQYFREKKMPEDLAYLLTKFISKGRAKEDLATWSQYYQTMKEYNVDESFIKRWQNIRYLVSRAHSTSYAIAAFQLSWYKVHYPEIYTQVMEERKELL